MFFHFFIDTCSFHGEFVYENCCRLVGGGGFAIQAATVMEPTSAVTLNVSIEESSFKSNGVRLQGAVVSSSTFFLGGLLNVSDSSCSTFQAAFFLHSFVLLMWWDNLVSLRRGWANIVIIRESDSGTPAGAGVLVREQ